MKQKEKQGKLIKSINGVPEANHNDTKKHRK